MNTLTLSRLLGWFSVGLGATEIVAPSRLSRALGLPAGPWLVRLFGLREVAAGFAMLARPEHAMGPAARVAGDALDIAVLVPALSRGNPRREAAQVALAMVLGVTALDVLCASALVRAEGRRAATARRTRIAR